MASNSKKLWFSAKRYGYGWTPLTWEGWFVIAVYVLLFVWVIKDISHTKEISLWFILKVFALILTLLTITYVKGEPPKWRWGKD